MLWLNYLRIIKTIKNSLTLEGRVVTFTKIISKKGDKMKKRFRLFGYFLILVFWIGVASAEEGFHLLATMSGDSTGDMFSVVAGVGDVNGDGYDDVLVGAPGGGYAKLYFGGVPFDTVSDLKFVSEKEYSQFGYSVAGGGDLNSDGFADIVIGSPNAWLGISYPYYCIWGAGKVYVYFGGSEMDTIPDLELVVGNYDEDIGWYYHFGHSVSIVGDLNNNGYDDIIVGAPSYPDEYGRVYIYSGGADMDTTYDILIENPNHTNDLGESVSWVGDVNKDGFDDMLVGSPRNRAAYLIYGGNDIGLGNSELFEGDTTKRQYGRVVAGLGDVNGDGFNDFGIMALDYIRIFLGGKMVDSIPDLTLIPDRDFWYIGGLGDLNKDGFDDIGVVSKYFDIFFGNTTLDTIPDISFSLWYSPVCGLGDVNGDSNVDIGLGRAAGWDPTGKVYIYSYGLSDGFEEKEEPNRPNEFDLSQNYPNPFNLFTTISYDLPFSFFTRLEIYNLEGKKIKKLVSESKKSGSYYVIWDGKDENNQVVSSGIYFVKMAVENFGLSRKQQFRAKKLLLLK